MSNRPIRVYAHIFFGKGIEQYSERYRRGLEGNRTPYAFHLANELGFTTTFSSDGANRMPAKLLRRAIGLDIAHAWHNRTKIAACDVVWTMTENESLAIAMLMMLGLVPRRPIISSSVWMVNEWKRIPEVRKRLVRRLSRYVDVMTVQSEKCLVLARTAFRGSDVRLMYFGTNTSLFRITPSVVEPQPDPIVILSAGNDRTRDWPTLIAAFGGDPQFQLRIWCQWLDPAQVRNKPNIVLLRDLTMEEYAAEIAGATICAIPMKENIFSGITFALNSAAMGRPILCSDTGGVPTYFAADSVLYVPVGDAEGMRSAVLDATPESLQSIAANAQRTFIQRDYSNKSMVRYYAEATRDLFDRISMS